jgi:DNA-binding HxlR family transcriptional regulator
VDTALRTELASRGVAPDCVATIVLVRDVLARVGDKWTVLIITALASGPLRFTALHEQVVGISQRMLSQTLRALTRDGLVTRTAYAEVPPRVEYALTPLGRSLTEAVDGLVRWVQDHQADIVGNRDEFDQTPEAKAAATPRA